LRWRNQAERIVVGAGTNSADNFFGFSGRENEFNVGWWFFDNLQECIETLWGDHVRFVKNENLVSIASWGEDCALAKIAGIINTVVRCRVNFNNIT
jgi:hypothetical protein